MSKRIREFRQTRAQLTSQMRAMLDKASAESRDLTAEETTSYDTMDAQLDALGVRIEREEKLATVESALTGLADSPVPVDGAASAPVLGALPARIQAEIARFVKTPIGQRLSTKAYGEAFDRFLATGFSGLSAAYQAALQADNDATGGFLKAPIQMVAGLIQAIDDELFIRRLATIQTVTSADSLGAASLDADPADPDWTSEIETGTEDSSMKFGKRELHPHPLAKRIKVSNKLLRLTAGGAESLVRTRLGRKFAVAEEKGFLTGDGASKPLGLFTPSDSGISTARDVSSGSSTAITPDALIDAKYALKPGYSAKAAWIFHREGIKRIRKLKDQQNQYLWTPGISASQGDRILDLPFYMSEFAPSTFTTGKYVGILGDFSFYWIAEALSVEIQRLNELYAEKNQTGFIGRMEVDGMPVLEEAFVRLKTD